MKGDNLCASWAKDGMQESRSNDAMIMDLMARVFIYAKKWKDNAYGSLKKIVWWAIRRHRIIGYHQPRLLLP